jgi:predicted nucleotidyltransferase
VGNTQSSSAKTPEELRCRIDALLNSEDRHGREIVDTIDYLQSIGRVAIFGGMLRDLAREGVDAFNSDVDLVVNAEPNQLEALVAPLRAERNKFGGYRVYGEHWVFDVWTLQSTWAAQQGHIKVKRLKDLVKTTFFDCDAIVYDTKTRAIHTQARYFEKVHERIVDINLPINPNPGGVVARSHRIISEWNHTVGPRLTKYLRRWWGGNPAPHRREAT